MPACAGMTLILNFQTETLPCWAGCHIRKERKRQFKQSGTQRAGGCDFGNQTRMAEETTMTKKAFDNIMAGLQDALAYSKGDKSAMARVIRVHVKPADIKTARRKIGLSRDAFARVFGLSSATLRKWENGERRPTGAARVLLTIISREPEAALRAIRS
jgi:putative transcriptional regulator